MLVNVVRNRRVGGDVLGWKSPGNRGWGVRALEFGVCVVGIDWGWPWGRSLGCLGQRQGRRALCAHAGGGAGFPARGACQ